MLEKAVLAADRVLVRALDIAVVALAGLLLVLLNYAVFTRFVLNASVSWGEELPAHLLATLTFVGAAYLTRTNEHLGFDSVVKILPAGAKRAVMAVNLALMSVFSALVAWYGAIAAMSFSGRALISIDLPMALFRGAMPLGAALICAICAVRLAALLIGRISPDSLLPETDA